MTHVITQQVQSFWQISRLNYPAGAGPETLTLHYTLQPIILIKLRHPCRDPDKMNGSKLPPRDLVCSFISAQVYCKSQALLCTLLPALHSAEIDPKMSQLPATSGQEDGDKDDEASRALTTIPPQNISSTIESGDWPLLLKDYLKLLVRNGHYTPIPHGSEPYKRDIKSYISSGIINLDKPSNPSSHEVVAWLKRILR